MMRIRQIAVSVGFAGALAALPVAAANAQSYPLYPPCSPFPLAWPFCVVGAVVGTAAMIVTAPFVALTLPPYNYTYYAWPYFPPPPPPPPRYYAPSNPYYGQR